MRQLPACTTLAHVCFVTSDLRRQRLVAHKRAFVVPPPQHLGHVYETLGHVRCASVAQRSDLDVTIYKKIIRFEIIKYTVVNAFCFGSLGNTA